MLYIGYFIILNGQNIKKILKFFPFMTCGGVENYLCSLCAHQMPHPNSNFEGLGGFTAQARWA